MQLAVNIARKVTTAVVAKGEEEEEEEEEEEISLRLFFTHILCKS